jgi:hypothetical protein
MLTLATGIRLVQGRFVLSTDAKVTRVGATVVVAESSLGLLNRYGECVPAVIVAAAACESQLISARTREASAVAKTRNSRLGAPRQASDELLAYVVTLRGTGLSTPAISRLLNAGAWPLASGKEAEWTWQKVAKLLRTQDYNAVARGQIPGPRRRCTAVSLPAAIVEGSAADAAQLPLWGQGLQMPGSNRVG